MMEPIATTRASDPVGPNGPEDRRIPPGQGDGGTDDRPARDGDEQPPAVARVVARGQCDREAEHDRPGQRREPLVGL